MENQELQKSTPPLWSGKNTHQKRKWDNNSDKVNPLKRKHVDDSCTTIRYVGLKNEGAMCYLNTILQILFMTKDFREAVMRLESPERAIVSYELKQLFTDLKMYKENASKTGICKALDIGNSHEQQDAAEYLQKILQLVTSEIKGFKIFQGEKTHCSTCLGKCKKSIREELPFFSMIISLKKDQHNSVNVQNSWNDHFDVKYMNGENQLYCPDCEEDTDREEKCELSEFPEVLVLHLKRFYLDYKSMTYRKNDCPVIVPLLLEHNKEPAYALYAEVNHIGSLKGGHYYANIKSFENDQCYEFNDSIVNSKEHWKGPFSSDSAYLLLYKYLKKKEKEQGAERNIKSEPSAAERLLRGMETEEDDNTETKRISGDEKEKRDELLNQTQIIIEEMETKEEGEREGLLNQTHIEEMETKEEGEREGLLNQTHIEERETKEEGEREGLLNQTHR